jgi:hypothetical protein
VSRQRWNAAQISFVTRRRGRESPYDAERASSDDVLCDKRLTEVRVLEIVFGVLAMAAGEPGAALSSEPPVVVSGACACPAPANVEAQLAALAGGGASQLSPDPTATERHHAELTCPGDGSVDVVLRRANGERIADRELAAQGSCGDLASAIAVIIGAWEADLDPRVDASIALPAPPVAAPAPPPQPPAVLADREEPRTPIQASVPPAPPRGLRFSVGVGLLASLTGGRVTPGATVEGDVLPAGGHLGVAGAVTATTARDSSVGTLSDAAQWSRVTLGLGPDARFTLAATRIDLQAQAIAAVLTIGGHGVPSPSSGSSPQFGGAAAVRTAWAWGTSAVWVGTQVLIFPGDDRLVVKGLPDQGHLPHIELQLASGLSLGRFP